MSQAHLEHVLNIATFKTRPLQDEKSLLGYFLMVATIQTFTPSDTLNEAKQEINDAKTMINILFLHKLLIYKRNHDLYKIFGVSSTLLFFFFCLFLKYIPCFIDSFESEVQAFFFNHIFPLNIYTLLHHFLFSTSEKMLITSNEHAFNKISTK